MHGSVVAWVTRDPEVSDGFKSPRCSASPPSMLLPIADLDTGGVGHIDVCSCVFVFMLAVLKSHEFLTFNCISWKFWMVSQRAVFFLCWAFGAGAGTGHFFLKLLGADARTHPGFSERELIPLDFSDGEIKAINDACEQYTITPFCPVRHNLGFHTAVSPDFLDVSYLIFQKARPAMSVCDISFSRFVFLATATPLTLQLWDRFHVSYGFRSNTLLALLRQFLSEWSRKHEETRF